MENRCMCAKLFGLFVLMPIICFFIFSFLIENFSNYLVRIPGQNTEKLSENKENSRQGENSSTEPSIKHIYSIFKIWMDFNSVTATDEILCSMSASATNFCNFFSSFLYFVSVL